MDYKISDTPLKKGRYDHLVDILMDGKTLQDLDKSTCQGARQRCYQLDIPGATMKIQPNGLYSLGLREVEKV